MERPYKTSKKVLKDIYEVKGLLDRINSNYMQDVNNPNRAENHYKLIKEAREICQKWIDGNDPL